MTLDAAGIIDALDGWLGRKVLMVVLAKDPASPLRPYTGLLERAPLPAWPHAGSAPVMYVVPTVPRAPHLVNPEGTGFVVYAEATGRWITSPRVMGLSVCQWTLRTDFWLEEP